MTVSRKIPKGWQQEIDNQTPFGIKAKRALEQADSPPLPIRVNRVSTIGDRLHDVIFAATGEKPCADCIDEINRLNTMTVGEVMSDIDTRAEKIVERAKTKAQKWYVRAAASYASSLMIYLIKEWIMEACSRSLKDESKN